MRIVEDEASGCTGSRFNRTLIRHGFAVPPSPALAGEGEPPHRSCAPHSRRAGCRGSADERAGGWESRRLERYRTSTSKCRVRATPVGSITSAEKRSMPANPGEA